MKFICLQENLIEGVGIVAPLALRGGSLPVLSSILLKVEHGALILSSTNLEVGVTYTIRGKVEQEGECIVSGKLFFDLVALLPEGQVVIELTSSGIRLLCQETDAVLRTSPAVEFPIIPTIDQAVWEITITKKVLLQLLKKTVFAAGRTEQKPQFSGVLVTPGKDKITAAATDGFRLAETQAILSNSNTSITPIIIPLAATQEIVRALALQSSDEENVTITASEHQVTLTTPELYLVSRLIAGAYPDYQSLFPPKNAVQYSVNSDVLVRAVKATALFSRAGIADVTFSFSESSLVLHAENADLGKHQATVPVVGSSKGGSTTTAIVLNARYVLEGIAAAGEEKLLITLTAPDRPIELRPDNESELFRYIVMPIRN